MLGVRNQTQNNMVYGELGRWPLRMSRYCSMIRYWCKVIQLSENKYVKRVYNMMLNDIGEQQNRLNWVNALKSY